MATPTQLDSNPSEREKVGRRSTSLCHAQRCWRRSQQQQERGCPAAIEQQGHCCGRRKVCRWVIAHPNQSRQDREAAVSKVASTGARPAARGVGGGRDREESEHEEHDAEGEERHACRKSEERSDNAESESEQSDLSGQKRKTSAEASSSRRHPPRSAESSASRRLLAGQSLPASRAQASGSSDQRILVCCRIHVRVILCWCASESGLER